MLALLVWSSLMPSLTAHADQAVDPVASAPEVRRTSRRPYPRRLYDDWSKPRSCAVQVTLDDKGRPTEVVSIDCPEVLAPYAVKRVRRDRWVKPTVPGTVQVVQVEFVPPVMEVEFPSPQYWRRREFGACQVHVALAPDGTASFVRGDAACLPGTLTAWAPTPSDTLGKHPPNVCPVTFVVVDGEVASLDLYLCGMRLWRHVREGLDTWTWPTDERPAPYSMILEFDGPEAAIR